MNRAEAFRLQARHFARSSPLYERLARELSDEPAVAALLGDDVDWRAPLQLFSGLHYLVLSGRAAWDDVAAALRDERDFLRGWIATRGVHTNEVRRCWWLLPCFLEAARRFGASSVDLLELGCSAGLNLLWDRYRYVYANGSRGPRSSLVLGGVERVPVPRDLIERAVAVRSRIGVDRDPPDLRSEEGVHVLKAFVWADQDERLDQLEHAVDVWRADPPTVVVGDIVDELPGLLARPGAGELLLVWATAALGYLPADRRARARELLASAGRPLAFVETRQPLDGSHDHYGLRVNGDEVAHGDFHGAWLEWRA